LGGKNLLNMQCVFLFSLEVLSETFLILRRIERDIIKNVQRSLRNIAIISCQILMEFEFSQQIFEEYSNIKFHESPSIGSRELFHSCERTDGQDEANSLLRRRLKILKNFQRTSRSIQ
jgi:hypothetical protein